MEISNLLKLYVYLDNAVTPNKKIVTVRQRNLLFTQHILNFFKNNGIILQEIEFAQLLTQEEMVLAVFGNEDLYDTLHRQLKLRKEQGFPIIPLIIFSEDFFFLPEGEKLGYGDILDTISNDCNYNAVAFKESEVCLSNVSFEKYLSTLIALVKILSHNRLLHHEIGLRTNMLRGLLKENYNYLERQNVAIGLKILSSEIEVREKTLKDNDAIFDINIGIIEQIQEQNSKSVAVTRFPYIVNSSKMSMRIALKYGDAIEKIYNFLDEARKISSQLDTLNPVIREAALSLEQYAFIALVGNFSSGKTCFINTLISHKKKLRTSAGHNTAVLMEFHNAGEHSEKATLIYKDQVESILLDADIRRAQIYDGPSGQVAAINTERRTVHVRGKDGEIHTCEIRNQSDIIVVPGNSIKSGVPLTKGDWEGDKIKRYRLVSKSELQEIQREISNHEIKNLRLSVKLQYKAKKSLFGKIKAIKENSTVKGDDEETISQVEIKSKHEVLRYLSILEQYASLKDSIVNCSDIEKSKELEKIISITISYSPQKKEQEIVLTDKTWGMFSNLGDEEIFVESPACYLNCEKLKFFLNSEFLKYCTLIDTPGLGSVTEKHDAITERYIRLRQSLLIVMLRIDIHARSIEYFGLLNLINDIYGSNHFQKDNVIFIFNCYEDSFRDRKKAVNELCCEIAKDLDEYGFNKNNIYVCNLKKVMENSEIKESYYGFPSYKPFESRIRSEVERRGPEQMLRKVKLVWSSYFTQEITRIQNEIDQLNHIEGNRMNELTKYKEILNKIQNTDICRFETLYGELYSQLEEVKNTLSENITKKNWKDNESEIRESLANINEMIDYGSQTIQKKLLEIQKLSDLECAFKPTAFTFTFSVTVFMEMYHNTIENFPFIFNKKNYSTEKRNALITYINQEYRKTKDEYRVQYKKNAEGFQVYKDSAQKSIKRFIEALSNPDIQVNRKSDYEIMLNQLQNLQSLWNKTVPVIDKSIKGG